MSSTIVVLGKTHRFSERLVAQRFKSVILKRNALLATMEEARIALRTARRRRQLMRRFRIANNQRNGLYAEQMLAFRMARKVLTPEAVEAIIALDEE